MPVTGWITITSTMSRAGAATPITTLSVTSLHSELGRTGSANARLRLPRPRANLFCPERFPQRRGRLVPAGCARSSTG